jgi:AcrR family transcriptional regulator
MAHKSRAVAGRPLIFCKQVDTISYWRHILNECLKHLFDMSPTRNPTQDTTETAAKSRILDAAERLFAEHGIAGVPVRDITKAAGVNVASVNYYFGSKTELVKSVFLRRLEPIDKHRHQLLDKTERESGGKPPKPEAVLEALILPIVERGYGKEGNKSFFQLMGRCFANPDESIEPLLRKHAAPTIRRFDNALMRALPGITKEELFWQVIFVMGALHHALPVCGSSLRHRSIEAGEFMRRFVTFAAAGLRASAKNPRS